MATVVAIAQGSVFQSTLSMSRATHGNLDNDKVAGISIHALHEESDFFDAVAAPIDGISIHALHEESDAMEE